MERKADPQKVCAHCGKPLTRRRNDAGRLEDLGCFLRRQHCSRACGNSRSEPTHKDTYHWRARQMRGPVCVDCGATEALQAHHIDHNPRNNDPANVKTLCASCHTKLHWKEGKRADGKRSHQLEGSR